MSILDNDFDIQAAQKIESSFVYCDIVDSASFNRFSSENTLMDVGKIIGPLDYTNYKLEFVRDYRDIMNELNVQIILKELGFRKILSISCHPILKYKYSDESEDSSLPNKVRLLLFVRLYSGATTQYQVIYKYIKDTIR